MFGVQVDDPEAVPVRDASTIMLLRDGVDGIEVCMLRRNLDSDFVGGAYVFPGGAVDPDDAHSGLGPLVDGPSDRACSELLGMEHGGSAFWIAAIRETFEEAGLLLASTADGSELSFVDQAVARRFSRFRRQLEGGALGLVDLCHAEGLTLATRGIHYFSRWVTPLGAPRRYDTRFFVAMAPAGQEPVHDDREVIESMWVIPSAGLAAHRRSEMELILPTVRSLEALARFPDARSVLEHAAGLDRVDAVVPTIEERPGGLRLVLPGDEVYDASTHLPVDS